MGGSVPGLLTQPLPGADLYASTLLHSCKALLGAKRHLGWPALCQAPF